jgi:hypothetical protein
MTKKLAVIIIVIALAGIEAWAASSSASYKIASGIFDSGSALSSSSSFKSLGKARAIQLFTPSSTTYIIGEGFLRTAYFKPAILAPIVTGITPDTGLGIGKMSITNLAGANFKPGATVKLTMAGETDIIATNINVVSSTEITCEFDLMARKTGKWNVVVTNPDTSSGTLPLAFTIGTWVDISIILNQPNPFNPPAETTTLLYKLANNTDVTVVIFTTTGDMIWKRIYLAGSNGGRAGDNSIVWTGLSDFSEMASNGVYLVHVVENSSGKTLCKGKIAVIRR